MLGVALAPAARAADAPAAPATAELEVDGLAILREWQPPKYPSAELAAKHSGMVNVRLIIDETGRVTAARALEDSDEAFVDAALAAVKSWVFAPALERSKPIACCLETLVTFSPVVGQQVAARGNHPPASQTFVSAPKTPPKPMTTPDGGYPDVLIQRKLNGVVRFICTVSPEGRAIQSRIAAASHADFVLPALEALQRWTFTPGTWGDLTVVGPVEGQMSFDDFTSKLDELYVANGLTAPDGARPSITPDLVVTVDPVWPLDRLLAGEDGSATVEFTVGESGAVKDIRVREASQPEFGEALAASMAAWQFDQPIENHRRTTTTLARRVEFVAVPLDAATESSATARLVVAMRKGEVAGAKGLDEKLVPLYRVAPIYPATLLTGDRPNGTAEIEFVIDRDGRARLCRITSATHPEFGWAAATAVSQWLFKAPLRAGQATEVKVKIPFNFVPPAS